MDRSSVAMRVIGGKYRRRQLFRPGRNSGHLRPTYDFVRENIFNLIAGMISDAHFLDLFAGTGSVGIEALSRGAADCVFVDSSQDSLSLIQKNCVRLGIEPKRYRIIAKDALDFLRDDFEPVFNVVFLDPPYGSDLFEKSIALIGEHERGVEESLVVGQRGEPAEKDSFGNLIRTDQRKYGITWVSLWSFA
ncbi:MAG: 16S rRNA (guanine(966)-N(2))-methyltransferase RsmD [bacterium]